MGEAFIRNRVRSRMPKFTYTGTYQLIDDGHGNWRIKFLSSGTLTFRTNTGINHGIDVFLVGGGGRYSRTNYITEYAVGNGGGGYTKTQKNVSAVKGTAYTITVGGTAAASSAFGYTANPGGNGTSGINDLTPYGGDKYCWANGGDGGSGGSATYYHYTGANGGTNGGNGGKYSSHTTGGTGQGTTTREFGESGGTLYSTGGGDNTPNVANSGNGGYWGTDYNHTGGFQGKSGIVVIRNHR